MSDLLNDPLRLLQDYPALTRAEREAADRVLETRVDLADAHADARALAALLDAAGDPRGAAADDALTEHVAATMAGRAGDPALAERIARDPALRAEADARREALARLDAATDPVARFEQLSGRALVLPAEASAEAPGAADDAAPRRAAPERSRTTPGRSAAINAPSDRPAVPAARVRRPSGWVRTAAFAVVACALAWSAVAVASRAVVPERARVADLGDVAGFALPTLRGDTPQEALARYHALAREVAAARRTTLGLFPRYDTEALAPLEGRMAALAAEAPAGSDAQQEAGLAAARIALYLGRDEAARQHAEALVATGGYRSPVARRLVDYLAAEGSASGPASPEARSETP